MKFSILLPVKKGLKYTQQCVESILNQTLPDFNLLILLDNSTPDGTYEYLLSIKDTRINIYLSETSLTIEENWSRIMTVPKNEFITMIGYDDMLKPTYLETMNKLINKFPDATLYQTHYTYIDSKGQLLKKCKPMKEKESGSDFLESILQNKIDIVGTGFMMRSKDYDEMGGIPTSYPNLLFADFELWLNLTIKNYKATSPGEHFYFRLHQSTTSVSSDEKYQQSYEKFIYFLETLKLKGSAYKMVIAKNADKFIMHYCKSLSHRIMRTPKEKRGDRSVNSVIEKSKSYARLLSTNNNFHPLSTTSVRLAKLIDSNAITRNMFLLLKKIYKKPLLK